MIAILALWEEGAAGDGTGIALSGGKALRKDAAAGDKQGSSHHRKRANHPQGWDAKFPDLPEDGEVSGTVDKANPTLPLQVWFLKGLLFARLEEPIMSKDKLTETLLAITEVEKRCGADARLSIHPDPPPGRSDSPRSVPDSDPGQSRQGVLRIDGPALRMQDEAGGGVLFLEPGDDQSVTTGFLCNVPVSNDVLYCRCGGILSQRFNESLFCRTCGQEGTR